MSRLEWAMMCCPMHNVALLAVLVMAFSVSTIRAEGKSVRVLPLDEVSRGVPAPVRDPTSREYLLDAWGGSSDPSVRVPIWQMSAAMVFIQFAAVATVFEAFDREVEDHVYEQSFREPPRWVWDEWYWDYAVHPWFGAEYYLIARNRGWNAWQAMAYSAALSVSFEYLAENILYHPSANDLIVTPLTGAALGELRYYLKRRALAHAGSSRWNRVWAVLLDPIDVTLGGFPDGRMRVFVDYRLVF